MSNFVNRCAVNRAKDGVVLVLIANKTVATSMEKVFEAEWPSLFTHHVEK